MVDVVAPAQFSTINYVKDNENISATKQGSTVTLVGDKNGTRQMQLVDFVKNELPNAKDIKLENSLEQDSVEIKGKEVKTSIQQNQPETNPTPPKTEPQLNVVV